MTLTKVFPVSILAYVFRLCLEYARLAADNRDAMDFKY